MIRRIVSPFCVVAIPLSCLMHPVTRVNTITIQIKYMRFFMNSAPLIDTQHLQTDHKHDPLSARLAEPSRLTPRLS